MGRDGMHSLEACVNGSHREGNQLHVRGMDRSGGGALGCLGWTGIGIHGRCGRTSSWLAPHTVPSKHQIAPSVRLVGPSIVLDEHVNRLGTCSGTFQRNHQPPRWLLPLQPLPLPYPPRPLML
ncbi:hypothetical protein Tco_0370453 [Tanacetum coccineum]